MSSYPIIHSRQLIENNHGTRELLDLEFSNGERRRYERAIQQGNGAVMIAAMPDRDTVLLIKEYAAGTDPNDLADFFKVLTATKTATSYTVTAAGKAGRSYVLAERPHRQG